MVHSFSKQNISKIKELCTEKGIISIYTMPSQQMDDPVPHLAYLTQEESKSCLNLSQEQGLSRAIAKILKVTYINFQNVRIMHNMMKEIGGPEAEYINFQLGCMILLNNIDLAQSLDSQWEKQYKQQSNIFKKRQQKPLDALKDESVNMSHQV